MAALVTVQDVADWLGIDLTGDSRSLTLMGRFVNAASTKVESWCRQNFGPEGVIADHNLTGMGWFYLARTPVTTIASIAVDAVPLLTTDYTLVESSGLITLLGTYATSTGVASVSYTGGLPDVPDQVKEATIHVVSMLWYAKGRDAAMSQQSAGQFTKTLNVDNTSGLPVSAETLLLDYRRVMGALA